MATLGRDAMIVRILEGIGVIASGQTAATADSTLAGEALDSAHDRLSKQGLAPFSLTNIPEWAQVALRDYVGYDLAAPFGITGQALAELAGRRTEAEKSLAQQVAGRPQLPYAMARYF